MNPKSRINLLCETLETWLDSSSSGHLDKAIQKTVEANLFPTSDVDFAVKHLRSSLRNRKLISWLEQQLEVSGRSYDDLSSNENRRILCLHAGNLPLVGFQDVLAVLAANCRYAGKLSRKDPHLIASFLEVAKSVYPPDFIRYTSELSDFAGIEAREWMFAGSDLSLKSIEPYLLERKIIVPQSRSLRRVAHFSAAVIGEWNPQTAAELAEAILRYGGKGCRSVAMVYTNLSLVEATPELIQASRQWFETNDYPGEISPFVRYRMAYNEAMQIPQVLAGTHLIQEGIPSPDNPEIVYWLPKAIPEEIRGSYGAHLQEVYVSGSSKNREISSEATSFEPLFKAQRPEIDWRPDGVDVLEWVLVTG